MTTGKIRDWLGLWATVAMCVSQNRPRCVEL